MKNKNIGMILLALFLILDALLGFGLNIGPAVFLLYLLALGAGIFILIGKEPRTLFPNPCLIAVHPGLISVSD